MLQTEAAEDNQVVQAARVISSSGLELCDSQTTTTATATTTHLCTQASCVCVWGGGLLTYMHNHAGHANLQTKRNFLPVAVTL